MTTAIETIKDIIRCQLSSRRTWEDLSEDEQWMDAEDVEGYVGAWTSSNQRHFDAINEAARKALRTRSAAGMKKALLEMRKTAMDACLSFGEFISWHEDDQLTRDELIALWHDTDEAEYWGTVKAADELLARI